MVEQQKRHLALVVSDTRVEPPKYRINLMPKPKIEPCGLVLVVDNTRRYDLTNRYDTYRNRDGSSYPVDGDRNG